MAKKRKKKTSKKKGAGQTLGALALIISLAALGIGLTQFFLPPKGPTIYSLAYNNIIEVDFYVEYLSELQLTYSAKAGNLVLIDFCCEIFLDPSGTTDLSLYFDVNSTIFPTAHIRVSADYPSFSTGYMKHYINSSEAGDYTVYIYASIDDEFTGSYIRYSLLTVTVY